MSIMMTAELELSDVDAEPLRDAVFSHLAVLSDASGVMERPVNDSELPHRIDELRWRADELERAAWLLEAAEARVIRRDDIDHAVGLLERDEDTLVEMVERDRIRHPADLTADKRNLRRCRNLLRRMREAAAS
jgi:hypothetical protein